MNKVYHLLQRYRALLQRYRALLQRYISHYLERLTTRVSIVRVWRTMLLQRYRALLQRYWALLQRYWARLQGYRALLWSQRYISHCLETLTRRDSLRRVSHECLLRHSSQDLIDSCCCDYFLRNSLVALPEALFARVFLDECICWRHSCQVDAWDERLLSMLQTSLDSSQASWVYLETLSTRVSKVSSTSLARTLVTHTNEGRL